MARGKLAGKAALVTGASSGIGRAVALALAAEGADVIASGRGEEALRALAAGKGAGPDHGAIRAMPGDLRDAAFVRRLADSASGVDILVNNAGVLTYAPILELTAAECEDMFRVNVMAALQLAQSIGAAMASRKRGHIVVMTSLAAREVYRFGSVYCASKHALAAITQGLRIELQGAGVKVTEVAPGMVDTNMRMGIKHPAVLAAVGARPYKPLTADEVAGAVLYALTAPANCCPDLIELRPLGAA
jgi:NADP-dependent 3-hydroxy acid dehydrogenase YdfG